MITRANKNVVCIRDIPSNLIEEAIFILKPNVKGEEKNAEIKRKSKEIIIKEAEEIINEYVSTAEREHELNRQNEREKRRKIKKIKTNTIFLSIVFVIACILISIFIK